MIPIAMSAFSLDQYKYNIHSHRLCILTTTMAASTSDYFWQDMLKSHFAVSECEIQLYISAKNKDNLPAEYAKSIFDGLKEGEIKKELYEMYREAVYGNNLKVRERIHKRMYFVGNHARYVFFAFEYY